ncbi:hypothetical protein GGR54DRAFT_539699 [Hypoxylon sp. NC1633]|nr:hypothetical protein GGR54DRAFT_539699 [Hypoxylon sp. NC1633]
MSTSGLTSFTSTSAASSPAPIPTSSVVPSTDAMTQASSTDPYGEYGFIGYFYDLIGRELPEASKASLKSETAAAAKGATTSTPHEYGFIGEFYDFIGRELPEASKSSIKSEIAASSAAAAKSASTSTANDYGREQLEAAMASLKSESAAEASSAANAELSEGFANKIVESLGFDLTDEQSHIDVVIAETSAEAAAPPSTIVEVVTAAVADTVTEAVDDTEVEAVDDAMAGFHDAMVFVDDTVAAAKDTVANTVETMMAAADAMESAAEEVVQDLPTVSGTVDFQYSTLAIIVLNTLTMMLIYKAISARFFPSYHHGQQRRVSWPRWLKYVVVNFIGAYINARALVALDRQWASERTMHFYIFAGLLLAEGLLLRATWWLAVRTTEGRARNQHDGQQQRSVKDRVADRQNNHTDARLGQYLGQQDPEPAKTGQKSQQQATTRTSAAATSK